MKLTDFVKNDLVLHNINANNKEELLNILSNKVADSFELIDRKTICQSLLSREKENSTGIGNSIAIPHCIDDNIDSTICLVATVQNGVDFDAMDGKKVKLIFLLVSPQGKMSEHIRLLARITRIIKEKTTVDTICAATNAQQLFDLIITEDKKHV